MIWTLAMFALIQCGGDSGTNPNPKSDPVPASVSVSPPGVVLGPGQTQQLQAVVRDASGAVMSGASVTWSSSDGSVATVSGGGMVTAVDPGDVTITARAGSVSGTVDVSVVLLSYDLSADTTLAGDLRVADLTVATGTTVTVTGDLKIESEGPIIMAGTMTGGCVGIELKTLADSIRVTGSIETACTDNDEERPDVRVIAGGAYTLDGASVVSAGDVLITNDTLLLPEVLSTSEAHLSAIERWRQDGEEEPCSLVGTVFEAGAGADGRPGAPGGDPGARNGKGGSDASFGCKGALSITGITASGGKGGDGANSVETGIGAVALGGAGGKGGAVWVVSKKTISIQGSSATTGPGGRGGNAEVTGKDVLAGGGKGGQAGGLEVLSGIFFAGDRDEAAIEITGVGGLTIEWGDGGEGGYASAEAEDGDDATDLNPAQVGGDAAAAGGDGGIDVSPDRKGFTNNHFSKPLVGALNIVLIPGKSGSGGEALAVGGDGGAGSRPFPDGANGGEVSAQGGRGGDSNLTDDRLVPVQPGTPGDGGKAILAGGLGGSGYSDCVIKDGISPGGPGGNGGDANGGGGEGGEAGDGETGIHGSTELNSVSNGGAGGNGDTPGAGGGWGQNVTTPPGAVVETGQNFKDGKRGSFCGGTFTNSVSLEEDTGGLEGSIGMVGTTNMFVPLFSGNQMSFSGLNPFPLLEFIPFNPTDLTFSGTGTDRFMGISDVSVSFSGTLIAGGGTGSTASKGGQTSSTEGRLIGYEGTLIIGEDGKLPGGTRVVYKVTGTRQGS